MRTKTNNAEKIEKEKIKFEMNEAMELDKLELF